MARRWPAAVVVFPLALLFLVTAATVPSAAGASLAGGPSAVALSDIPPAYLALYLDAARTCPGLPWAVLAGIGKVESDNGQSNAPGVHSGANYAGAEGPMQFEPATFAQYAVDADPPCRSASYDPADAIYTAAAMLCANGAASGTSGRDPPGDLRLQPLARPTSPACWPGPPATPSPRPPAPPRPRSRSRSASSASPTSGAQTGPDAYDCSGLVYAAYAAAGIRIGRTTYQWRRDGPQVPLTQIQPGDLLFSAGSDGTPD